MMAGFLQLLLNFNSLTSLQDHGTVMSLIVTETGHGGTMTAMRAEETATGIAMTTGIAGIMTEEVCHCISFLLLHLSTSTFYPFPLPTSRF